MEHFVDMAGRVVHAAPREPVVICIARTAEERTRLVRMFDGAGVLVIASDAGSARSFLTSLPEDEPERAIRAGGLRIDPVTHEASWHGRPLELTAHELRVLACLARTPGRAWTHRQLHARAWDEPYYTGPAALHSVVKRLRAKLRRLDPPLHVETVRGLGFRLAA